MSEDILSEMLETTSLDSNKSKRGRYSVVGQSISEKEDQTQYYDSSSSLLSKVKSVAELIRNAKHLVVFTGAGISTSANIPDYRGPQGIWTLRDKGIEPTSIPDFQLTQPTLGHLILTKMCEMELIKFLVSTNIDNLHIRAGFPEDKISELHGNTFIEKCDTCGHVYKRSYDVTLEQSGSIINSIKDDNTKVQEHWTGKYCEEEGCNGKLLDTIVRFNEFIPQEVLEVAGRNSWNSDVSLVLGTSMRVSPANKLPIYSVKKNNGKLIICNMQITPCI